MRTTISIALPGLPGAVDIVLAHRPGDDWTAVHDALCAAAQLPPDSALYLDGQEVPIAAASMLRPGSLLRTTPSRALGGVRLAVRAGVDCGHTVPLEGLVVVGREPGADMTIADPELSRRHAVVRLAGRDTVDVEEIGATNPVDELPGPGSPLFRLGSSIVGVVAATGDGGPVDAEGVDPAVAPEAPPPPPVRPPETPWLVVLLPAVVATGVGIWAHQLLIGVFSVAAAATAVAQHVAGRARYRRRRRAWRRRYDQAVAAGAHHVELLADRMAREEWRRYPDPSLWQARCRARDHLGGPVRVRLGVIERVCAPPDAARQPGVASPTPRPLPLVVPLADGGIAIRGPGPAVRALAGWVAIQAAACGVRFRAGGQHSSPAPPGGWYRWLPEAAPAAAAAWDLTIRNGCDGLADCQITAPLAAGPPSCMIALDPESPARMTVTGDGHTTTGIADLVPAHVAERMARELAGVADRADPASSWLEVAGLELTGDVPHDRDQVRQAWSQHGEGLQASLGVDDHGRPLLVDLVRDGPHLLVAGATGSGKSVLLQTLVVSLALRRPPDDLAFVLVDFKGGATFAPLADLPHVLSVSTDLARGQSRRIVESLAAELRRREALLSECGVPDLATWRRLATGVDQRASAGTAPRTGAAPVDLPATPPPRLVVAIDEFGQLAQDEPDLVERLVTVARRGRSLGVHLVLATQRPGQAVTADVRANTALRICLPVTSAAESVDVIDDSAAGRGGPPGRAWLRGQTGPLQVFQVSPVDTALPPPSPAAWVAEVGPPTAGGPTILAAAVAAARAADRPDRVPHAPPWMPPLPARLPRGDLPCAPPHSVAPTHPPRVLIGLADLPEEQCQPAYALDLGRDRHVVVYGGPRSGRTTALVTVAEAVAEAEPGRPLYGVHAGLSWPELSRIPSCGGHAGPRDEDHLRRLLTFLAARLQPAPVLFVDDWDALADARVDGEAVHDVLLSLAAAPRGPHLVVAAGRAGSSGRLSALSTRRLLLGSLDPAEYRLAGLPAARRPPSGQPGRAIALPEGLEVQLALPAAAIDPTALAQGAALDVERTVPAIRPMPTSVPRDLLAAPAGGLPTAVPLGVGGLLPSPVVVDVGHAPPGFLVAGPRRSGRSTCLAVIAAGLRENGVHVLAVGSDAPSPARDPVALAAPQVSASRLAERPALLEEAEVVLIDDVDRLAAPAAEAAVQRWLAADASRRVVLTGQPEPLARTFAGLVPEVRRGGSGLLLHPRSSAAGDLFELRLPRRDWSRLPPGRGVLVCDATLADIQVACP